MSKQALSLPAATELLLRLNVAGPTLTAYTLGRLVFEMFRSGTVGDHPLRIGARAARRSDYYAVRSALLDRGLVQNRHPLPNTVLLMTSASAPEPAAVLCGADPFGFVSHLSAMTYHGLSNRLPKVMFFTTLVPPAWAIAATERMQKDLGDAYADYVSSQLPLLQRPRIQRFQGSTIEYVLTREVAGAFRISYDTGIRVSTIGRTFLDMLQRPELCGGMPHVINVFEEQGRAHLPLIINEISAHGTKIDRVRAGYILEERCGLHDPRIGTWVVNAQRGGSRKLDPAGEYASTFSDRWMLSINT